MNRLSAFTLCSALSGLLLLNTACDKSNNALTMSNTRTDGFAPSFVGVHWQMVEFTLDQAVDFNGDGKPDTEMTQFLNPCDLDNTITFARNGTMAIEPGQSRCDSPSATKTPKLSNWTYDSATKTLRIVDQSTNAVTQWSVLEASASYLKVKTTVAENGHTSGATMTWKRA